MESNTGNTAAAFLKSKLGPIEGLSCYLLWGSMPIYWKLLSAVSSLEVLAWRMAWSCVFVVALCALVRRQKFLYLAHDPRAVRTFVVAGALITVNWGVYVWATSHGHIIEASIGYYLCPFCNIALGVAVFGERLTPVQVAATCLAIAGVVFFLANNPGDLWVSLLLAVTFSIYGAVKKHGGYSALPGMAFESLITGALGVAMILAGALAPWLWQLTPAMPDAIAVTGSHAQLALLVGSGIATAAPLLLYSAAANRITMTLLGFFQYVSPSIALVVALAFFGEQFTLAHGVCLGLIWAGIAAVATETFVTRRRRR